LNVLDIFPINNQISIFIKFLAVGAEPFLADGQTDMTKLIVAFHSFAQEPSNVSFKFKYASPYVPADN